jgi:hypothetical protein
LNFAQKKRIISLNRRIKVFFYSFCWAKILQSEERYIIMVSGGAIYNKIPSKIHESGGTADVGMVNWKIETFY